MNMHKITRYDREQIISSSMDHFQDIQNLITSLTSNGFVSDLLREVHGFKNNKKIKKTAKSINLHTNIALGLSKQAFSGPVEASFLPSYYAILNYCKIQILLAGGHSELERNRSHGAHYNNNEMNKKNFFDEEIKISDKGSIPLLYKVLTNKTLGKTKISMGQIYPHIDDVSAEYFIATKTNSNSLFCSPKIIQDDKNGHHLRVEFIFPKNLDGKFSINQVKAFKGLQSINGPKDIFESIKKNESLDSAKRELLKNVDRYLLRDRFASLDFGAGINSRVSHYTQNDHLLPEELLILIAFFHLSNVVRYNPEHLYKLKDSANWAMLLALSRHGFLRYLKVFWSNVIMKTFDIRHP